MNISTWLIEATKRLKDIGIESNRLDAELILAETLHKNRTYLHAHLDEEIDLRRLDVANARLQLRLERVPMAYILGQKEFYGREFMVTPQVLIPRPESESIIELFLEVSADDISGQSSLIDIGTGSGCLGITAKLERPDIDVTLVDISEPALNVASKNAEKLEASVNIQRQNLLYGQIRPLNYILANLPYVDEDWQVSPETEYEPELALYADNDGLKLIYELIDQTPRHLVSGGWLILEADPRQHQAITNYASKRGLSLFKSQDFCLALRRESA